MYGFIQINSQPTASTIIPNTDTEFEIDASLNDSSTSGMGYQWQMNGSDISNGSFSTQNITVTPGTPTSEEVINYSFSASATGSSADNTFIVPAGAENVRVSLPGAPGGNGAAEGGNAGGVGGHGMSAWFDVIGDNSTIDSNTTIGSNVMIGHNVRIGSNCTLQNCILGNNIIKYQCHCMIILEYNNTYILCNNNIII